jgi:single-stranded-DNA-specific exonuclease
MKTATTKIPNPTPDLNSALESFRAFVRRCAIDCHLVIMHDRDADGITAGVVLQKALERMGYLRVDRVMPDRDRNAWTPANRDRVQRARPELLFVLDLGSGPEQVLEGVPTCFIDHHRPEGIPEGQTLITAYGWHPIPNTSLLVWEMCDRLVNIADLGWIAAIGVISDLGEHAPFGILDRAKEKFTAKYLKEATTLINAIRRSPDADPETAASALLRYASPKELVLAEGDPDVQKMREARIEVARAMNEAKKAPPVFAGPVALVRIRSRYQVHPLIAQIWRGRLPGYYVIVANDGYLPGWVNFSARSAPGLNVLEFLQSRRIREGEGSYGHGHDQASGGSLPIERWNQLLEAMGFPETVFAGQPQKGRQSA